LLATSLETISPALGSDRSWGAFFCRAKAKGRGLSQWSLATPIGRSELRSSDVIGKQVLVNGKPATIIGVTPKPFHGTSFALDMDGYLPLSMAAIGDPAMWTARNDRRWITLGRMKPGISVAQAQSSINVIAARLAQQYPDTEKSLTVNVVREPLSHPVPLPNNLIIVIAGLFLFLAALILLLAGVNVANILLVPSLAQFRY
jgi:putative ABC transport system permease protein